MFKPIDSFYLNHEEPNRSCFLALRELILGQDERIRETLKFKMPCFAIGKKLLCYLWSDKKTGTPYILMVDGNRIDHPELVAGDRKKMKVLYVASDVDLQVETIVEVLQKGLALINATI
jgi:hypothetical protein